MKKIINIFALSIIAISSAAISAEEIIDHTNHKQIKNESESSSTYTDDYIEVNTKMHVGMNVVDKGDPDEYFVESMIAHHIGAVEMARVQIKYGKDPELIKLAENIISAQIVEIEQMKKWLENKNGPTQLEEDANLEETINEVDKHH